MAISDTTRTVLIAALILITLVTLITSISINLSTTDPAKKNNTLISQTTIFGFVIICLAVLLYISLPTTAPATVTPVVKGSWPSITLPKNASSTVMAILLFIGIITAFVTTSIDLTTSDAKTKQNIFISQAVIFTIVIIGLAFTAGSVFGDDLQSKDMYAMVVVHASLVLSIVSLSANIMSKLASASSFGAAQPLISG